MAFSVAGKFASAVMHLAVSSAKPSSFHLPGMIWCAVWAGYQFKYSMRGLSDRKDFARPSMPS